MGIANYIVVGSDKKKTFVQLCREYNVSIEDVINLNNIEYFYDNNYKTLNKDEKTLGEYISKHRSEKMPEGIQIRIPATEGNSTKITNQQEEFYQSTFNKLVSYSEADVSATNKQYYMQVATRLSSDINKGDSEDIKSRNKFIKSHSLNKKGNGFKVNPSNFNCYMVVLAGGSQVGNIWYLPTIPEDFSENTSSHFNAQSVFGRSVAYQIYTGTEKAYNFSLKLHSDLVPDSWDSNYIYNLVNVMNSACYPLYEDQRVRPPEVVFSIGNQFYLRGIMNSVSVSWHLPILSNITSDKSTSINKYSNCEVNLSITETTGPYSMSDISSRSYDSSKTSIGGFR